VSIIFSM